MTLATFTVPFGRSLDCSLIHLQGFLQPGPESRAEIPFESPGLDWTASQVELTLTADAEVEVIIDATQGILRILDGRPSTSDLCSQSGEGSYVCSFQWPILEAQTARTWSLIAINLSSEPLELELILTTPN